jgi:hypothetical protein
LSIGYSRLVFALCGWGSAKKFGEKPEACLIALLFCVFTVVLHGDAVPAQVSMVEKESTLRFSVFFLRLKSGESPQCCDCMVL